MQKKNMNHQLTRYSGNGLAPAVVDGRINRLKGMFEVEHLDKDILLQEIPVLNKAVAIEKINKGYSQDRKYIVHFNGNSGKMLLRVSSINEYEIKHREFTVLQDLAAYHVRASKPVHFGVLENLNICYMVLTYIDGSDAGELLPQYTSQVQYNIGLEAGRDLKRLHQYPAPIEMLPWHDRKRFKHLKYIEEYKTCGITLKDDHKFLGFIEDRLHVMKDRPNVFLHDDFHVNNLIVKDEGYAGVIDFNRYDWGDPLV